MRVQGFKATRKSWTRWDLRTEFRESDDSSPITGREKHEMCYQEEYDALAFAPHRLVFGLVVPLLVT